MTLVNATIWIALLLFLVGESGRSLSPRGHRPPSWAWWAFLAGWIVAIVHTLLAFALVHGWSHDDAVRSTAEQTEAMFGFPFGAGVYVNYVFFAVWLADAWWWRSPQGHLRPASATWGLRAFYMLIVVNAAVVFVPGIRRVLGLLIVSWLARIWAPGVESRPSRLQ